MKLYQLLKDYPVIDFIGSAQTDINQIAYDSRRVLEGTLFVCLLGEHQDGHDYIYEALNRKAAAILVQQPLSESKLRSLREESPATSIVIVQDSREALAFVSCNFYEISFDALKIHLLIGEIGKGSCGHMLYSLLDKLAVKASLIDDMQILSVGKKRFLPRNHPEMTDICAVLSELQEGAVILPFNYKDIQLKRGHYLSPHTCTVLQADDKELRQAIAATTERTFFFINADALSPYAKPILSELDKRFLSYGIDEAALIRARRLRIETRKQVIGTAFTVDYPDGSSTDYFIALPGRHHVSNALALLSWAYYADISRTVLQEYLSELSLPGRSELVLTQTKVKQEFSVIIDNAWSAIQMKNLLQSLRPYCRNRLLVLASAGGDRSKEMRRALAAEAVHAADYVCFTVSNPRSEGAKLIIADMTKNLDPHVDHYECIEDRATAIKHIIAKAQCGDLVVLSGKAQEAYHIDAQGTEPFSEFEAAQAALLERMEAK